MIDRLAPTRRPDGSPQGYQRWESLLFLHWAVPVDLLRPLVPESLELDLYQGVAYVGVVPFVMKGVRPSWCPKSLAFNFLETNVRTYVTHGDQPGVYFFSLDASSRIAVCAARWGWSLPYFFAQMHIEVNNNETFYETRRVSMDAQLSVRYELGEILGPSQPETLEHFLLERYLMFVPRRDDLLVGQVHHAPYPAQEASVIDVHDELIAASGLPQPKQSPDLVHYAAGVDVEVFALRPVALRR